jgi:hypothetical protein
MTGDMDHGIAFQKHPVRFKVGLTVIFFEYDGNAANFEPSIFVCPRCPTTEKQSGLQADEPLKLARRASEEIIEWSLFLPINPKTWRCVIVALTCFSYTVRSCFSFCFR